MNIKEMTIFLIDDDPVVCDALSLLLKQSGLKVECFNSADAFLDICHAEMQGCAIVDFNMPIMNGIQLQEEMSVRGIPLPIVFLTGTGNIPLSVRAMKAGASDFLTKPVTQEKLLSSIHVALLEFQSLQSQRRRNQHSQAILSALTQRENDVMKLALKGHTSKKIANCLGISHRTVEIHKARLMKKAGAENILDLARIAHDAGITVERGVQNDLQNRQSRR
ncbi:MAG: response regulator transcription factor [Methylomonas sp.]